MKKYLRYIYAVLAVPLAILLRYALMPLIGHGVPYVSLFVVTGTVAVLGGLGPSILTAILGSIATDYFFIPPLYTFNFTGTFISQLSVVTITSAFIGYIGDALRAARSKAESQAMALSLSQEDMNRAQLVGSIGSWRLDVNKNILTWSDENHRIFGIPKGTDLSYETFLSTIHPDDREYVDMKWKAGLAGENYDIEHRIIADGRVKWVREKAYLEFDSNGNLLGGFGITQDITEKKQNEEAILRAKQEWERTFDSVSDMIAILDDKHHIVRVNSAMAKYIGKKTDECIGLPCYFAVHGSDSPPSFCPHSMTIMDRKEHVAEIRESKFGKDLLINTTPLLDEQERIIGSVHLARDITERKRDEEALRNERAFVSAVLETAGALVVVLDKNGCIVRFNRSCERTTGYSFEEVKGKRFYDFLLIPEEIEPVKNIFSQLRAGQFPNKFENFWIARDGTQRLIHWTNTCLLDSSGKVEYVIATGIDITATRRIENELRQAYELLEAVTKGTEVIISAVDKDYNYIFFNEAYREEIRRLSGKDIRIGTNIIDTFKHLPEQQEIVEREWKRVLQGESTNETLEFGDPKHHRKIYSVLHTPIRDKDGNIVAAGEVAYDITKQAMIEDALRQSEQRLRLAQNASNSGSWEWDLKTNENIWSDELWKIYGLKPHSCVPSYETWRQTIHPDDILKTEKTVQEAVQKGSELNAEWRVRHSDGSIHWLMSRGQPLRNSEGQVDRYIGIVIDITDRKKAEQELLEAKEMLELRVQERTSELQKRAEQLARLTSELTLAEHRERQRMAQILHDHLQQILVGAKIQTELLLRRIGKDMQQELKHVIELLNESIAASRSLTAELSPPIPRDSGLIAGLEWLTRWMKEKYGLTIILEANEQTDIFRDDLKILLFQAVRELLLNVVKHADVTSAKVELTKHDTDNINIIVSDNGVGFDHENILSNEKQVSGGYGLFSIKERLSTFGGKMKIESKHGKGSCFTLIVPTKNLIEMPKESVIFEFSEHEKATHEIAETATASVAGRKIKVLLADDHVVMRQGLSRLLGEEPDIQVIGEASNGVEAIEKSIELKPDVILMDYNMPDMDGAKATRIIRDKTPHIKVIGLSMYEEPEQAAIMKEAGAVAYVTKSGKPDILLMTIRRCISPAS